MEWMVRGFDGARGLIQGVFKMQDSVAKGAMNRVRELCKEHEALSQVEARRREVVSRVHFGREMSAAALVGKVAAAFWGLAG